MPSNYEKEEGVYYRFGGAALSGMLKTRYKMIQKCKALLQFQKKLRYYRQ